ncbi:MAG: 50S ribosomal protein L31 [Legionellales bacterium]|nr:50S ribosomal protein L31 [Legionellales bacterium]|tara:strand:+ start:599 stop:853 length:255 start_codon:yes stop_codon:yes gene_type:complete
MTRSIHPNTQSIQVSCGGCGNTFKVISTYHQNEMSIELCYLCHPAYTGQRKISRKGKIDRFAARYEKRTATSMTQTGLEEDKSS